MKKALVVLLFPSVALAGGFEFPDNTTEALGRGGAFTAKADSPAALQYNIAGLARQRGTSTLLDINIVLHDREFTRLGNYGGDPNDPMTPWAGQPYPTVRNVGAPQIAPFLGITTDFGKLDRWTFGIGIFGPSSYGHRDYGGATVTINTPRGDVDAPNPSRYDVMRANLLLIFPTLAAAVRVTKWLDIGLALHIAVGTFDLTATAFTDFGRALCPYPEYHRCDALNQINTKGASATAAVGFKITPIPALQIGINLRGPVYLTSTGEMVVTPPVANPINIPPTTVQFQSNLPWVLRLGVRYAFIKNGFEHGDVEVNGIYEAWNQVQGEGAKLHADDLFPKGELDLLIRHNFRDTFGVRLGGAYNVQLPKGVFTARLGFAWDSAATNLAYTRLDFNTGMKLIPTVGLSYRIRGVAINLAYAYMYEPDRYVSSGDIRPNNAFGVCHPSMPDCPNQLNNDANGRPLPVVNNGSYAARTMTISFGITINWDEALKKQRTVAYQ
jgi:long-subunit fatty acid transport protein